MRDVSTTIVRRVADHEDAPIGELSPLYRAIDPDALDALFASVAELDRNVSVEFQYEGYTIVVRDGGEVEITPTGTP